MKDVHGEILYRGTTYPLVFNINVLEEIQEKYGSLDAWGKLTDRDEPDVKAIKYGFACMLNEGIDIQNEESGENMPFLSLKQVGRIISEVGFGNAVAKVKDTVIKSTESLEKNA